MNLVMSYFHPRFSSTLDVSNPVCERSRLSGNTLAAGLLFLHTIIGQLTKVFTISFLDL